MGFLKKSKSDRSLRSDRNKIQFLRMITVLNFEGKVYLTSPELARLCVLHEISNAYNSKENSTCRSVIFVRNVREFF